METPAPPKLVPSQYSDVRTPNNLVLNKYKIASYSHIP